MDGAQRPNSMPRVLPGSSFDGVPYNITLSSDEPFGRGGSAVIYKGDVWYTEPFVVAVKIFHDFGMIAKEVREELLDRELRAVRQVSMRHQSILAFLGTAQAGQRVAIVSLYMKNGNLLDYLKAHRVCDKTRLILQVAEAVNYLHTVENLVHGDLKCANILISDYGNALLADFGLSRFIDQVQSVCATVTGIRQMHTARFAAPELLVYGGDPHAKPPAKTCETDVYAFGMLILEALTEKSPWSDVAPNDIAVVLKVYGGELPPRPMSPSGFVSISHAWWDVCKGCWRRDPGHRPPMPSILDALTNTSADPYRKLVKPCRSVESVVYFPGGHRVVYDSSASSIRVWDSLTGRTLISPLRGHFIGATSVAVSPDVRQICAGYGDGTICRWDAESGTPIDPPMAGHDDVVNGVVFSPNSTRIASCSDDKTVRLWDATTGQPVGCPMADHTDWVWSVAFSLDGVCIASGSEDGTVRLCNSATGTSLGILKHNGAGVLSVRFSPDRIHLVSGDTRGTARIWNILTRQLERQLTGHSDWVRSVSISPSERYIATASDDQTIRIWDSHTGDPVGMPLTGHRGEGYSIEFLPDGRGLVSGSENGTVRIWDLFE